MKLVELAPDPTDVMDPLRMRDDEEMNDTPTDTAHKGEDKFRGRHTRGANMKKAMRIRTLSKMKAKAAEKENTDTASPPSGHGSTWMHR